MHTRPRPSHTTYAYTHLMAPDAVQNAPALLLLIGKAALGFLELNGKEFTRCLRESMSWSLFRKVPLATGQLSHGSWPAPCRVRSAGLQQRETRTTQQRRSRLATTREKPAEQRPHARSGASKMQQPFPVSLRPSTPPKRLPQEPGPSARSCLCWDEQNSRQWVRGFPSGGGKERRVPFPHPPPPTP